jgi:hypothetical protein
VVCQEVANFDTDGYLRELLDGVGPIPDEDKLKTAIVEVMSSFELYFQAHLTHQIHFVHYSEISNSYVPQNFLRSATQVNASMSYLEVAQITSTTETGERVIRFKLKAKPLETFTVGTTDHHFEPVCYPLLFTHGEKGWGCDIAKQLPFMQYLAARMLRPERILSWNLDPNGNPIMVNRFNVMSRLGTSLMTAFVTLYLVKFKSTHFIHNICVTLHLVKFIFAKYSKYLCNTPLSKAILSK